MDALTAAAGVELVEGEDKENAQGLCGKVRLPAGC